MTDTEREGHIQNCGRQMQAAYAAGNRQAADGWLQAQAAAIRTRSPAVVAAMESDYFGACGTFDRARMLESLN